MRGRKKKIWWWEKGWARGERKREFNQKKKEIKIKESGKEKERDKEKKNDWRKGGV